MLGGIMNRNTLHPHPLDNPELSIAVPMAYRGREGQIWRITGPWLKLELKYGLIGPWGTDNPAVIFDAHALSRGPSAGLPNQADFEMTEWMNSGIKPIHKLRLSEWL